MSNELEFTKAIEALHNAEHWVIEAQAQADSQRFQYAQQHLQLANQLIHKARTLPLTSEQQTQILHATEQLRHLQETQAAVQQIHGF
ncbi:hypothetical protein [Bacillus sp. CGMCC 1.16541]|uniref:hypothetical protein n=1 Tax=Bacillus sp. CGMCC 1.16541 TaxID=2185143 RepID=UPI000D73E140|nr:hypothetical protein [Bacillus sp. CGMCC 1.16541]